MPMATDWRAAAGKCSTITQHASSTTGSQTGSTVHAEGGNIEPWHSMQEEQQRPQQLLRALDLEQQLLAWQTDGVCFPVQVAAAAAKTNSITAAMQLLLPPQLEQQQQQQQLLQQAETAAALKQQVMLLQSGKCGVTSCSEEDGAGVQQQQQQLYTARCSSEMEQPYELQGGADTRQLSGTGSCSCSSVRHGSGSDTSSCSRVSSVEQQQERQKPDGNRIVNSCSRTRSSSGGSSGQGAQSAAMPLSTTSTAASEAPTVCKVHAFGQAFKPSGQVPRSTAQTAQTARTVQTAQTAQTGPGDKIFHQHGHHQQQPRQQQQHACKQVGSAGSYAATAATATSRQFKPRPPTGMAQHKSINRPGVQLKHSRSAAATSRNDAACRAAAAIPAAAVVPPKPEQPQPQQQQLPKAPGNAVVADSTSVATDAATDASIGCSGSSRSSGIACISGLAARHAGCVPIAVARHCPHDVDAHSWQPSDFVQTHKLYEGKIATVLQGYHSPSRRPLALKVYNRSRLDIMERFQLAREVCLHMRSCHPYIASLYAAFKDAGHIYLLMELAPRGNLYQLLMSLQVPPGHPRRLDESSAVAQVIKPLLTALAFLHEQGIIHRDIKLENVLLASDGSIKLADFGLSIDTQHEPANTRLGTQGYFAPEVLALPLKASPFEGKSPTEAASRPSYTCKVDVWSAGVVCFEVLTGRAPFAAENVAQVVQAILHRTLVYPKHLSPEASSFLKAALTRDPAVRPTSKQLLQHPFIVMHSKGGLYTNYAVHP